MLMLDICSGLGGASAAMKDRGWDIVTVDIHAPYGPSIVADVAEFSWHGKRPDLIWCSPPCTEFSREIMPWTRTGNEPSLDLVRECKRIIDEAEPRYWVIENVRGAIKYLNPLLGKWRTRYGPFYMWGHFPDIGSPLVVMRKKESYSSTAAAQRAMIPYPLSEAVAVAIERQPLLFEV